MRSLLTARFLRVKKTGILFISFYRFEFQESSVYGSSLFSEYLYVLNISCVYGSGPYNIINMIVLILLLVWRELIKQSVIWVNELFASCNIVVKVFKKFKENLFDNSNLH